MWNEVKRLRRTEGAGERKKGTVICNSEPEAKKLIKTENAMVNATRAQEALLSEMELQH